MPSAPDEAARTMARQASMLAIAGLKALGQYAASQGVPSIPAALLDFLAPVYESVFLRHMPAGQSEKGEEIMAAATAALQVGAAGYAALKSRRQKPKQVVIEASAEPVPEVKEEKKPASPPSATMIFGVDKPAGGPTPVGIRLASASEELG
jgi:hypothetical protein